MIYEWAKPGVKVVCVNADQDTEWNKGCWRSSADNWQIEEGRIYVIRSTFVRHNRRTPLTLRLEGLYRQKVSGNGPDRDWENGYSVLRFRPLINKHLPDSLTILLEKPNRLIVPSGDSYDRRDGGKWDVRKTREKEKSR